MRSRLVRWGAAVSAVIGLDELLLVVGLALLAYGFWLTWSPGAFLVPGAVLVWIALPSRRAFIDRPAPPARRKA